MVGKMGENGQERWQQGESKLNFLQGISPGKTLVAERRTEKNGLKKKKAGLVASSKYW